MRPFMRLGVALGTGVSRAGLVLDFTGKGRSSGRIGREPLRITILVIYRLGGSTLGFFAFYGNF